MKTLIRQVLNQLPYVSGLRRRVDEQGAYGAGHYYSPIPSREDVAQGLQRRSTPQTLIDVDLRADEQLRLLEELSRFYQDLPFPEQKEERCRYYFDQPWFRYTDAIMLYSLIRHFQVRRIIEVGSGFSSAVMLDTMEKFAKDDFEITFVEPYASRLKSLISFEADPRLKLIERKIQEVGLRTFDSLEAGDLLFVDSSHVLKYQSDLHMLLFEILPRLPTGVYVHFHDIFYPFDYPDEWLKSGRYWNECYALRAFLAGNSRWEVLLFNHYANLEFADFIDRKMPLCRKDFGGSLYLRKVS